MWQVGVQGCPCCAWHGSMPGNHAQVGLIRLFCGRSRAARTTFSLNAWSYVVRFFLVREPGGDEVGVGIGTFSYYWDCACFVSPGEVGPEQLKAIWVQTGFTTMVRFGFTPVSPTQAEKWGVVPYS